MTLLRRLIRWLKGWQPADPSEHEICQAPGCDMPFYSGDEVLVKPWGCFCSEKCAERARGSVGRTSLYYEDDDR